MTSETQSTRHQLDALIQALASRGVVYAELDSETQQRIQTLIYHSPGFASVCASEPDYLIANLESDELKRSNRLRSLKKQAVETVMHQDDPVTALHRFHRKELIRLAWKDLCGLGSVETITQEISNLAEAAVEAVFQRTWRDLTALYGTPVREDTGAPAHLCVIALGKFGGKELNFSSDIDLMFVYDAPGKTEGGAQTLNNREFFVQLAQTICDTLSEPTSDGFMYRVDTRIRPEGSSGALAVPLMTIEIYYPAYGQNWERQALLKARPVAGHAHTAKTVMDILTPFTYRKYVDEVEVADVLGGIHELRKRMLNEIGIEEKQKKNFKNGYGAIREIEFFVQAVQLLYGGQYPEIKLTGTLQSLRRMNESHLLPTKEYEFLSEAYRFLRRTEHRMQMIDNRQIYELPESPGAQQRLADSMGFENYVAFLKQYNRIINRVRGMYNEVFHRDEWKHPEEIIIEAEKYQDEIKELLQSFSFQDCRQAFTFLKSLQKSAELHLQPKTTRLFKAFLPRLLLYLKNSPDADMALANFEKIVESYKAKTALYQTLCDSPPFLELLVSAASNSHFLTTLILRDPSLIETLGRDGVLKQRITQAYLQKHIEIIRAAKPGESHREHILRVQNAAMFQSGVRFLLHLTDMEEMGKELTEVADFVLHQSVDPIHQELAKRYPEFTRRYGDEIVIIGMGKLGGNEFNVASDCDIILLYPISYHLDEISAGEYFHRWASKYIHYLEEKTNMGFLYHADARLRPHGGHSPLACSFDSFIHYYRENAQFWEKMALSRARVVYGNRRAFSFLQEVKEEILFQRPMNEEEKQKLLEMRRRIELEKSTETLKAAPGGIIDVEFIAQAIVLTYGHACPAVRLTSTLEVLRVAAQEQWLPADPIHSLLESYLALREVENRMRIVNNTSIDSLPDNEVELEKLTRRCAWKTEGSQYSPDLFLKWIEKHTQNVRTVYNDFFNGI